MGQDSTGVTHGACEVFRSLGEGTTRRFYPGCIAFWFTDGIMSKRAHSAFSMAHALCMCGRT